MKIGGEEGAGVRPGLRAIWPGARPGLRAIWAASAWAARCTQAASGSPGREREPRPRCTQAAHASPSCAAPRPRARAFRSDLSDLTGSGLVSLRSDLTGSGLVSLRSDLMGSGIRMFSTAALILLNLMQTKQDLSSVLQDLGICLSRLLVSGKRELEDVDLLMKPSICKGLPCFMMSLLVHLPQPSVPSRKQW
ncbi:hypothetical protein SO802_002369 [Lithocarpus litseifolius]|uniref:Uncharacterized protein n=1 Tax=Lithocarpus litseifolius TaxID=425828 RepID=A0AAW2DX08_9ROSI